MTVLLWERGSILDLDFLIADVTLTEEHKLSTNLTTHPVESGAVITDHALREPDSLRARFRFTDTPLSLIEQFNFERNRAKKLFDKLQVLLEESQVLDIYTKTRIYRNMILTNLDAPRDGRTGGSIVVDASFQRVVFAISQTVPRTEIQRANPGRSQGKKQLGDASDDVKRQTDARKILGRLTGW